MSQTSHAPVTAPVVTATETTSAARSTTRSPGFRPCVGMGCDGGL